MWEACADSDWKKHSLLLNQSIFFDLDFIHDVANSYSLRVEKLIYIKKGNVVGMCALYLLRNNVVTPDWFIETPVYINKNNSEQTYLTIFEDLLITLKNRFTNIRMRLPVDFYDIRPCIWNGYEVKVKYTHVKDNELVYRKNVIKHLRQSKDKNCYSTEVSGFSKEGMDLILKFQRKLGVSEKIINHNMLFFESQKDRGRIKFLNVRHKDSNSLLCSLVVLVDSTFDKAHLLMISDTRQDSRSMLIHTYLYDFALKWAHKEKIGTVDFCGANIKSISIFKSSFGTELKSYFYIEKMNFLNNLIYIFKSL